MTGRIAVITVALATLGLVVLSPPAAAEPSGTTAPGWAWRSLETSGALTCGIRDDGSLKCWGVNGSGQLGQGDTANRGDAAGEMGAALPPIALGPGRTASQVSMSAFTVCAVLDDARVKCWGANGAGALGIGTTDTRGDQPGEMGANLPAVDLGPDRTARQVSVGEGFACALLDDGSVKCWGANNNGQLGQGDMADRGDGPGEMGADLPAVDLGPGRTAVAVSAGGATACAIRDDHSLVCWGNGAAGQLGSGLFLDVRGDGPGEMGAALPAVDLGPGRTASAVAVGFGHVCAVLDDGSVKCWGFNDGGQLGLGDTSNRGDQPGEMGAALPAVDLGPGRTAVGVSAGNRHTCALLDDGSARCWGENDFGALGLGDTDHRGDQPGEMGASLPAVDLGDTALSVSAGSLVGCAVLRDGSSRCWGGNVFGGLGQGDTVHRGDGPGEMGANLPAIDLGPLPAAQLRADYRFLRSRVSSMVAAPNLVNVGPGTNSWAREPVAPPARRSVLRFPQGNGVDVPRLSSVVPTEHYTVAALFRVDALDNAFFTDYVRVLQWTDDATEHGLYVFEGQMEFYPRQSDDARVETVDVDEWVQVAVTRSRTGRLRVYLDGVPALDFSDEAREGVVSTDDVLRLFRDDTEEDSSGAIARLRLWNRPLTPAQIAGLGELPAAASVTRSRPSAPQQGVVRVTGSNFGPLEQVRIQIRDRRGTTRSLATPRSTRAGRITRTVYIPAAMVDGPARIIATGLTSQLAPSVSIRIT